MFKGEYSHTIDTKGRLIIPAKFRELLGEEFTITKGLDGCLFIYSNEDYADFEAVLGGPHRQNDAFGTSVASSEGHDHPHTGDRLIRKGRRDQIVIWAVHPIGCGCYCDLSRCRLVTHQSFPM